MDMMKNTSSNHLSSFCKIIHHFLVDIFYKLGLNIIEQSLVTITEVQLTKDKRVCKVFLSSSDQHLSEIMMQMVSLKKAEIKVMLMERLRFKLRYMPKDIYFFADHTMKQADRVLRILDELSIEAPHSIENQQRLHQNK